MDARLLLILALGLGCAGMLSACFPYRDVTTGAIGCHRNDIQIRETRFVRADVRTWTAICGDAQYLCSSSRGTSCTRVDEVPDLQSRSWVQRSEELPTGLPTVHAHVQIDVRRALQLDATPTRFEGASMNVRVLHPRNASCNGLKLTLNGVEETLVASHVRDEGSTFLMSVHLAPVVMEQLLRPLPSVQLATCGQQLDLDSAQVSVVATFARLWKDMQSQVEAEHGTKDDPLLP